MKIELLVSTRNFSPLDLSASMNSAAPAIGSSSCTSTPSMSVSQVCTGRDSLMGPSVAGWGAERDRRSTGDPVAWRGLQRLTSDGNTWVR